MAIPKESKSCEEETELLTSPEGLWTVLVVNCPSRFAAQHEPSQHLTPIAQYIRGVTASLYTQRINAESIYETLIDQIRDCGDHSLFDDEHFTKSTLYHWTIKTCDELRESIASSLRFVRRALDSQINGLCKGIHCREKLGVEYWKQNLEDEIYALEELQAQILALNAQVQESVGLPQHVEAKLGFELTSV